MKRSPLTALLGLLAVALIAPIVAYPLYATILPQNQPGPTDPNGGGCSQSDCSAVNCNCGVYPGYSFTGWCACSSTSCNRYCHFDKNPS